MTSSRLDDLDGRLVVAQQRGACSGPQRFVTHAHHALVYLERGAVVLETGVRASADAGALIVIPAGVPHRHVVGKQAHRWCVGFRPGAWGLAEGQPLMRAFARIRRGATPVVPVPEARHEQVQALMQALQEECGRDRPESPELQRSLLVLLLGEILRGQPDAEPTRSALVADVMAFIQTHSLEPISLADAAAAVHRSPGHVATAVKRATGRTVGHWIQATRLGEGAAWLGASDAPVAQIAAQVGYPDPTHFIRLFKRRYGETPAAWRRARRRSV